MNNICLHCLAEGDWKDEDKCPSCTQKGHNSPYNIVDFKGRTNQCNKCSQEYFLSMDKLRKKMGIPIKFDFTKKELEDLFDATICLYRELKPVENTFINTNRLHCKKRLIDLQDKIMGFLERLNEN